jgi:signal-transduction protein with cAMP-binding, CBS, and nucleotidyltransferase domain
MKDYTCAKDIANPKIVYIDGLATVKEAIEKMKTNAVDVLIIEKRNEKDANGMLTISDIVKGVIIPDKNHKEVSVYEIMTKPVISIPASLNLRYIARFLNNAQINTAPVEENGNFIGIISLKELVFNHQV